MKKRSETQKGKLKLFEELEHLSSHVEWTQGVSNLLERIVWEPSLILGVSKAEYVRQIVNSCILELGENYKDYSHLSREEVVKEVGKKITKTLEKESRKFRKWDRCALNDKGKLIVDSCEAIRRTRFRSEEYLNAEFDIFMSLVPNDYLDRLYRSFFSFDLGNEWITRGDSGQFGNGSDTGNMHIDNVAYNCESRIFVGNELKLDAKKNQGQILKYFYLFLKLKTQPYEGEGPFININDRFALLFFTPSIELKSVALEVDKEISIYEKRLTKGQSKWIEPYLKEIIENRDRIAENIGQITWKELMDFNENYIKEIPVENETLKKVLWGFNRSLSEKCAVLRSISIIQ